MLNILPVVYYKYQKKVDILSYIYCYRDAHMKQVQVLGFFLLLDLYDLALTMSIEATDLLVKPFICNEQPIRWKLTQKEEKKDYFLLWLMDIGAPKWLSGIPKFRVSQAILLCISDPDRHFSIKSL